MSTELYDADISDAITDAELIAGCVATGKAVPPELAQRVRQRAQAITARLHEQYGALDIGVPAIRELRGELPAP